MQVPAMSATDDLPDAVAPRAAWLHSDLAAVTGNRPREESSPMPLAYQVALAAVRERERLANELHDGLGQLLAIAQMRVDELASACESDSNRRIVDELKSLLDEASRAAHAATFDLHSPVLDQLGLDAALRGLVDRARRHDGPVIEIDGAVAALTLPLHEQAVALRVVRELVANACRHSGARRVRIGVYGDACGLRISVVDDGRGFDPAQPDSSATGGFGLPSIRAQMRAIGGQLDIDAGPGRGTCATLALTNDPRAVVDLGRSARRAHAPWRAPT